jgi:hypothetical protein
VENLEALYFDGKRADTRLKTRTPDQSLKQKLGKKEHIVMIQEPLNKFIGSVAPNSAGAEDSAQAIISKLIKMNVDLTSLKVIGADGCPTNTGHKTGIIRRIQEFLRRALLIAICMLHLVELPLKKIYEFVCGPTKGPKDYSALDGELKECHEYPVVPFKRICPRNFPKINADNIKDLSQDQRYLFQMALAVKTGKVPERLQYTTPGPVNHARFLTTAARILRLYVTKTNPPKELATLATFVMRVYVPHWHNIKIADSVSMGSAHFFSLIQNTR